MRIKAKKSHENFVSEGGKSVAVFAVTEEECKTLGLQVKSDPTETNPAHCIILLPKIRTPSEERNLKSKLMDFANNRGSLFLSDPE